MHLDLTSGGSVASLFSRLPHPVGTLIIGARLPLVGDDAHATLLQHLGTLLTAAADAGVLRVLHVSSVAATDHLRVQRGWSEEAPPLPPLAEYAGAYDVFKRRSEEEIATLTLTSTPTPTPTPTLTLTPTLPLPLTPTPTLSRRRSRACATGAASHTCTCG